MGLWWPLGYHSLTGCQSLSITLPAPHHLQRPVGNRQNSHCQLPLPPFLILSDEGAGGPHEEAAEVQRGAGTPPQPGSASHPKSPHSRLRGWSPWPQAAIRLSLFNPQTLLQPRLGFQEPFRVCHSSRPWDNLLLLSGSPLPLFIWLLPPPATGLPQPLSDPVDHPAPQLSICVWPRTKLCVREGRHQSPSPQCRLPACTASPVLDTHSLSPSLHCPQSPFTLLSRSTSASPTHPESPGTRSAGPHLPPASDAPHPGSHLPLG